MAQWDREMFHLGVLKIGAVVVPVRCPLPYIADGVGDSTLALLFGWSGFDALGEDLLQVAILPTRVPNGLDIF